jgi:hypothetical protein
MNKNYGSRFISSLLPENVICLYLNKHRIATMFGYALIAAKERRTLYERGKENENEEMDESAGPGVGARASLDGIGNG